MLSKSLVQSFLVLGALSLYSCGGGGDGDVGSGSYLFYSGSIHALDPASPGAPLTVDGASAEDFVRMGNIPYMQHMNAAIMAGSYDPATQTVSNLHKHALVYAKKSDGKIYRVSALLSGGAPAPVQVSNEISMASFCSEWRGLDYTNPDNALWAYSLSGSDAICGNANDVYKMVRLNMSATEAPILVKQPLHFFLDQTSGVTAGWLVKDVSAVKRCDSDFANCTVVKAFTAYAEISGLLLNIDNALYIYNSNSNKLSAAIHTLGAGQNLDSTNVSGDNVYFVLSSSTVGSFAKIYSAPADGSATATLLATTTTQYMFQNTPVLTTDMLVYETAEGLEAVPKTGGAPTPLVTWSAGTSTTRHTIGYHVRGKTIYYSIWSNSGVPSAGMIDDDGSNASATVGAFWMGRVFTNTATPMNPGDDMQKILRVDGWEAAGVGKGFAGGAVRVFDPVSKAEIALLGSVPADIHHLFCNGISSDDILCLAIDSSGNNEVLFANAATAGSLTRVTNTPEIHEFPMW